MEYSEIQGVAKKTIEYIRTMITPGMKLIAVRQMCEDEMLRLGANSFWYWDIGAFCFSGVETTVSVSGKEYKTSDRIISENDIITIDLSPQNNDIWGDYARTIIVQNGVVAENIENVINAEWKKGLLMEEQLHSEMKKFVTLETSFEELYYHINDTIHQCGFVNLDFNGNLGHSIVKTKSDRIYIEKGNDTKLSEVSMFTFEPHISGKESLYGYKKEDIYYFEEGKLKKL